MNKKNWNALMLWNFVNDFIKGDESDPQKILDTVVKLI